MATIKLLGIDDKGNQIVLTATADVNSNMNVVSSATGQPVSLILRGGTTAETKDYIGPSNEMTVNEEEKRPYVHDGVTPGGIGLALRGEGLASTGGQIAALGISTAQDPAIPLRVKGSLSRFFADSSNHHHQISRVNSTGSALTVYGEGGEIGAVTSIAASGIFPNSNDYGINSPSGTIDVQGAKISNAAPAQADSDLIINSQLTSFQNDVNVQLDVVDEQIFVLGNNIQAVEARVAQVEVRPVIPPSNLLMNGQFQIDQRGGYLSRNLLQSNGQATIVDRWWASVTGAMTAAITPVNSPVGYPGLKTINIANNTTNTGTVVLGQNIPLSEIWQFSGSNGIFSIYMGANTGNVNATISVTDRVSNAVLVSQSVVLPPLGAPFRTIVNFPFGDIGTSGISVQISFSGWIQTAQVNVSGAQLEVDSGNGTASSFILKPYRNDLQDCLDYAAIMPRGGPMWLYTTAAYAANTVLALHGTFEAPKDIRGTPTLPTTLYTDLIKYPSFSSKIFLLSSTGAVGYTSTLSTYSLYRALSPRLFNLSWSASLSFATAASNPYILEVYQNTGTPGMFVYDSSVDPS